MCPFSCLFKKSLNELKLYSKCEDKLANQLEVTGVLNKVNQSYSMLKYLLSKDERQIMQFTKDYVINVQVSEDDEETDYDEDDDQKMLASLMS